LRPTLISRWRHHAGLIALALLVALWAPAAADAADKAEPISTAYCIDCVPFQFQDENGEAAGLIIDLWRLWSDKTGIEIDFRAGQWDETLRMVRDGDAEAHAGLFYNDERAQYLDYGSYLTNTETHFFIKKGLPAIEIVEDLAAFRVGVIAGDYVEGWLKGRLPEGTVIGFESYDAIMAALRGGQLQVFAADSPTGIFHLQRAGLGFGYEYPEDRPLYQTDWLVAAKKGNRDLLKTIDLGLALITDEERKAIEGRWIAVEAKGFELSPRDMLIIAAILVVSAVVGIVIWSVSLSRQIALRTQELRDANESSAAAQTRLLDAIDNLPAAFVLYDSEHRLLLSNSRFRDLYGYSEEETAVGVGLGALYALDVKRGNIAANIDEQDYFKRRVSGRREHAGVSEVLLANGRWLEMHERATSEGGLVSIQVDITERRQAEVALRESEERYTLAVEGANDGLWDWNLLNDQTYISPHMRHLLGLEEEAGELTVDGWRGRIHPDDVETVKSRAKAHLDGETTEYTCEYRALRADGTYRWVLDRGTCLRDGDGKPYRMAGSLGDITDRKQGELFLRTVVDSLPAALNIRDTEGRYVLINERMAGYFGIDAATALGTVSNDAVPGLAIEDEQYRQVLDTGRSVVDTEVRYEGADGADEFWLTTRQPILDAEGQIQYVLTVSFDITERKRAEQELADKETQLRVALDNMPGGMRLVDKNRHYVLFNPQYLQLYDFPEDLIEVGESTRVENLYQAERGDFGPGEPEILTDEWLGTHPVDSEPVSWERTTPSGKILQVST
jgi:PAS domain S-box-containing protein